MMEVDDNQQQQQSNMEDATMNNATTNDPPHRLMISKMVLENFKSYAGVREIGPFHQCFSSIVGPNGSGKSNVIDAMLFVFGKRAKKLRLNKVSELIHKSEFHQDCTYAKVSVHFQNIIEDDNNNNENIGEEGYTVVEGSGCVVSRMARKDSSSSYQLNGKNVKFRQVAEFLAKKGIDLDHNRFLILQGEVEMISMMPPKGQKEGDDDGLLEYLEDIIGSNKFVADTDEAWGKVEALSQVRQEHLHRVKALQAEKDALESAKVEAQALLQKERDIRRHQNTLYQKQLHKTNQQQTVLQEEHNETEAKLQTERDKFKDIQSEHKTSTKEYKKQQKLHSQIHDELTAAKQDFVAYERRDIQLQESLQHCQKEEKKLIKKKEQQAKKAEEAQTDHDNAQERIPQLEELLEKCKSEKEEEDAKLETVQDQLKDKTDGLRQQLDKVNDKLAPFVQERAGSAADLETAEAEVHLLNDNVTRNQQQYKASKKELASLDSTQANKRKELKKVKEEEKQLQHEIKSLNEENDKLQKTEATLTQKHKSLVSQAEEAKAAQQARGGRNPTVRSILEAAGPNGALSKVGIVGRLGDLATIDPKYDVAVSTACGMLDHIVVQTTAGAQRCLQYLRQKNLGRANFIPLDKMSKGAHDRPVKTPEDAPRLLDLIQPSHFRIQPALYLGVANTLVAPDLETASRWAYDYNKRWRVVTMDGGLIETSGTMSGGGKTKRKGGMRLSNHKQQQQQQRQKAELPSMDVDFQALDKEAQKAGEELQKCRKRRREIQKLIPQLTKQLKSLIVKKPKLDLEIESCDTTRETLTERLPELEAGCQLSKKDQAKLEDLEVVVEQRQKEMKAAEKQCENLEKEQKLLQKAILDAGGPGLKKQQAKCNKVLKNLQERQSDINKAKVEVKTSQKKVKKAQSEEKKVEKEIATNKTKLEKFQAEFDTLNESAEKVKEKFEEAKKVEAEQSKSLAEASQKMEAMQGGLQKHKGVEIEFRGNLEASAKQLAELSRRESHWETELEKLQTVEDDADDELSDDEDDDDENDNAEDENVNEDENNNNDGDTEQNESTIQSNKNGALPQYTPETLEQYSVPTLQEQIATLEQERAVLAKDANMAAIAAYRKKEADYLVRVAELDVVTEERQEARKAHDELRRLRLDKFMDGFSQITLKLKEMYQMITLGGDAELELVDSLDPFAEGIVFSVRPPKKSWKHISNLSGGEKTLSSLALVFALHHYNPTPLYVMDEIDAALDFKNVSIVANYIKEKTKNAQFIIISLRNNMFELADRLVGIYKTDHCTKSVTIDPRAFATPKAILKESTNNKTTTPSQQDT
eukprot:CAMPEP_0194173054 /NCGR_PEP_ID=MMETSP0154-20130528/7439_1 /TAXON_ID=1049557 /ORGANISM="Thalassiothrix antarctica, Strain L6-D1" /LENGTH=1322 /DNA_ID=CAMNT_0038885969 /DNA_START=60 /DNA_END=4024 /DNA_ORIENTATION=+